MTYKIGVYPLFFLFANTLYYNHIKAALWGDFGA